MDGMALKSQTMRGVIYVALIFYLFFHEVIQTLFSLCVKIGLNPILYVLYSFELFSLKYVRLTNPCYYLIHTADIDLLETSIIAP